MSYHPHDLSQGEDGHRGNKEDCPHFDCVNMRQEKIDGPSHYGGKDNPYECIKVIEAWQLGFNLGNTLKYISRAGKKEGDDIVECLSKAAWYLTREIENQKKKQQGK